MKFRRLNGGYEYKVQALYGEPFDCFFSFAEWNGKLWSVHRHHSMYPPHLWPQSFDNYVSDVIVTRWKTDTHGDLIAASTRVIGRGSDPRLSMVGGRPIALFRGALHANHDYYCYDFALERLIALNTTDPWFEFGKNWVPFDDSGRLGAIHGFSPLRILKIDSNSGLCRTTQFLPHPIEPRSHDNFSTLRGGTNALRYGDFLIGLGHATFATWKHYPYQWCIGVANQLEVSFNQDFAPLVAAGFNIIDPTSIHSDGEGSLWLGLCASERDWFYEQSFVNFLSPIDLDLTTSPPKLQISSKQFDKTPPCLFLIADAFASEVQTEPAPYSGRTIYEPGIGIVGPFNYLASGTYRLCLRYRAPAEQNADVGRLDLGLSIPGHYSELNQWKLWGSHDKVVDFCAEFEWEPREDERFALRVHGNGEVPLTAYDLRIWPISRREE